MNEFMNTAKRLAEDNLRSREGGPFGACIVKDGKVIGKGSNQVLKDCDPTAHAEISAIRDACRRIGSHDLSGCEIYTSCYPCPMCLSAIIWSNIKKVYYGNTKEDAAAIGFRDDLIYDYIRNGRDGILDLLCIDRDETIKAFEAFSNDPGKTIY